MGAGPVSSRRPRVAVGTVAAEPVSAALHQFAAAAIRNDTVDPITTELVRLRCAAHHDCHT